MNVSGIVCELSNAHNGSLDRALRIIEACADAGADVMKFQSYTVPELCELRGVPEDQPALAPWDHMTMGELYRKARTDSMWFPTLITKCEVVGLPWFSSVFGPHSLIMLESHSCPAYKLASLDVAQDAFRKLVMSKGKPVIQSTPDLLDLDGVVQLYCPPGYPQEVKSNRELRKDFDRLLLFGTCDGFSYHGTDWKVPALAAEHGAKIVEVHVQLDSEPSELEANCCLGMADLAKLVEAIHGKRDMGKVQAKRRGRTKVTATMGVLK